MIDIIIKRILKRTSLISELVAKDLKLRYLRPSLGFFWVILSPLLAVGIYYLIFSVILKVKIKEAPFILYLMSAVFSWRFFQDSLTSSVASLIDNRNLIRESNFPHYLIPLSIVLASFINFLPSLCILIIIALFLQQGLPVFILCLPFVLALHISITAGMALLACVLYVKWRDLKYFLDALLQILFYSTPVFYSVFLVRESFPSFWFKVYINNPFVGILNLYRLTVFKGFYNLIKEDMGFFSLIIIPLIFGIVVLSAAFYIYKMEEKSINDYLSY
ncbi:MAG: DUF3149 domain-containing protein [Candidatus Omnitrophica bacterium]|nr:DUF3149 domain-containing protein [Candidatus Omnitrophota bacterium]